MIAPFISMAGLIIDIAGGFFLAIEAIGIEKVANWEVVAFRTPAKLIGNTKYREEAPENKKYAAFTMFVFLLTMIVWGGGTDRLLVHLIEHTHWNDSLKSSLSALVWFVTPLLAFLIPLFFIAFLKFFSGILLYGLKSYKNGQIGLLGFSLLFVGFLLQFIGTLLSVL